MIVELNRKFGGTFKLNGKNFYISTEDLNLVRCNSKIKYIPLYEENTDNVYLYNYVSNQLYKIDGDIYEIKIFHNHLTDDTYCIVRVLLNDKFYMQIYHITDKEITLMHTFEENALEDCYLVGSIKHGLTKRKVELIMPISNYLVSYNIKIGTIAKCGDCISNMYITNWFNKAFITVFNNFRDTNYTNDLYDIVTGELIKDFETYDEKGYYSIEHCGLVYKHYDNISVIDYYKEKLFLQMTFEDDHEGNTIHLLGSLI